MGDKPTIDEAEVLARQMILRGEDQKAVERKLAECDLGSSSPSVEYKTQRAIVERQIAIEETSSAAASSSAPPGLKFATGLGAIARGEYEPPREIVARMIVEGKIHWLAAHPGSGKTTIGMHAAIEHMRAGGHCIWVDFEAGKVPTVRRLIECGATVEMVDDENPDHLFHLVSFPPMGAEPEDFDHIAAALEQYPGAMVVFDSCSKALARAGADENNPTDVTKWTTNIVIPTREAGATVIVIDHVQKSATEKTNYSRGAGSKKADTDIEWFVKVVTQFDRETIGRVDLFRWKDREGTLPERLAFEIGDGAGLLPMKQIAAEDEDTRDERNAGLRGNVLAALQEHSGPERKLSGNQVVQLVHSRKAAVLAQLGELVELAGSGVEQEPGANRSILYWYDPTNRRDFEAMA